VNHVHTALDNKEVIFNATTEHLRVIYPSILLIKIDILIPAMHQ